MGILNDIAKGNVDFVNGDVEFLSDSRNWPNLKVETHSKTPIKEVEDTTEQQCVESESLEDEE